MQLEIYKTNKFIYRIVSIFGQFTNTIKKKPLFHLELFKHTVNDSIKANLRPLHLKPGVPDPKGEKCRANLLSNKYNIALQNTKVTMPTLAATF